MEHNAAVKSPCVRYMVTGERNITGAMADEREIRDTKANRNYVLDSPKSNTVSVEDKNEIAQEKKGKCGRESFRNNSLSARSSSLKTF